MTTTPWGSASFKPSRRGPMAQIREGSSASTSRIPCAGVATFQPSSRLGGASQLAEGSAPAMAGPRTTLSASIQTHRIAALRTLGTPFIQRPPLGWISISPSSARGSPRELGEEGFPDGLALVLEVPLEEG